MHLRIEPLFRLWNCIQPIRFYDCTAAGLSPRGGLTADTTVRYPFCWEPRAIQGSCCQVPYYLYTCFAAWTSCQSNICLFGSEECREHCRAFFVCLFVCCGAMTMLSSWYVPFAVDYRLQTPRTKNDTVADDCAFKLASCLPFSSWPHRTPRLCCR